MNAKDIARLCYELNKTYCHWLGESPRSSWEEASEVEKQSCLNGVVNALDNDVTFEENHKYWMDLMLNNGWVYHPVRDDEKKQHPWLVPYKSLPKEQKFKIDIFVHAVDCFREDCVL